MHPQRRRLHRTGMRRSKAVGALPTNACVCLVPISSVRPHGVDVHGGCYIGGGAATGSLAEIEGGELMTVVETIAARDARIILTSRVSS